MAVLIDRQAAIDAIDKYKKEHGYDYHACEIEDEIQALPSAQSQYEELTPEEAASEIASESMMSAWHWLDVMIRLEQMGYVICRKR